MIKEAEHAYEDEKERGDAKNVFDGYLQQCGPFAQGQSPTKIEMLTSRSKQVLLVTQKPVHHPSGAFLGAKNLELALVEAVLYVECFAYNLDICAIWSR